MVLLSSVQHSNLVTSRSPLDFVVAWHGCIEFGGIIIGLMVRHRIYPLPVFSVRDNILDSKHYKTPNPP
jgi:hypothetical protein